MCSCDYFLPANYRCAGAEKDEFSGSGLFLTRKLSFATECWFAPNVKQNCVEFRRRIPADEDDPPVSREEIFDLNPLR
jgi:hypothetical protein